MRKKKSLTVQTTGKKGGDATLKRYGPDHFRKIAKKRWAKEKRNKKKK